MGLLAWIIFGALAGWVASMIAGTSHRQGCLTNIAVGIVGAFVGGFLVQAVTGSPVRIEFDLTSFVVAVIGSVVLLAIAGLARGRG